MGFPSSLLLKDAFDDRNPRTCHVCLPFAKAEGELGQGFSPGRVLAQLCLIWSFLINHSPRNDSPGVLSGRREVKVRKGSWKMRYPPHRMMREDLSKLELKENGE